MTSGVNVEGQFGMVIGMASVAVTNAQGSVSVTNGTVSSGQNVVVGSDATPEAAPVANGQFAMTGGEIAVTTGFNVGNANSLGQDSAPFNPNPVTATGLASLTDVIVSGDAALRVGTATSSFDDRVASAVGELNVVGGSMSVGNVDIATTFAGDVGRGTLNLTDTSLAASGRIIIAAGGDSQGQLNAVNSDISVGEDLFVSRFRGAIGTDEVAETRGILAMQGGKLDVTGSLQVGSQFQGGEGELRLNGVQATVGESFRIGASSNFGSLFGNGVVDLTNSSLGIGGSAFVDAGSLELIDSSMSIADYLVTESYNPTTADYSKGASADSVIGLTRSLLDIGGEFGHGVNDLLRFSLDGIDRGITYGAINANKVNLRGGNLAVDINFGLSADEYIFDLILSTGMDQIMGDFASLALTGLDPLYRFTSGVVLDDFGGGLVEVYRLAVTRRGVPEPASAVLLLLGMAGLIGVRRFRETAGSALRECHRS